MTTQLPSTQYTLEDLHEIAYRGSYDDMQRSLARALLAAYEQEPDYIRYDCGCCGFETLDEWRDNNVCPKCNHKPLGKTELFTHPAPSIPAVPEGWKLVPIDPTKDMLRAGQSVVGFWLNTLHCYAAMLSAAPDCRAAMLNGGG